MYRQNILWFFNTTTTNHDCEQLYGHGCLYANKAHQIKGMQLGCDFYYVPDFQMYSLDAEIRCSLAVFVVVCSDSDAAEQAEAVGDAAALSIGVAAGVLFVGAAVVVVVCVIVAVLSAVNGSAAAKFVKEPCSKLIEACLKLTVEPACCNERLNILFALGLNMLC